MSDSPPEVSGPVKVMAAIGHVCIQWARLEMGLLGVIANIEKLEPERAFIMFGGLDILPRVNMAINLARYAKLAPPLIQRLKGLRKALQDGLADRRNQAVHGAHTDLEDASTTLTMVRWSGDRRKQTLTAHDIHDLALEIDAQANEAWSIMLAIGESGLAQHGDKDVSDALG